MNRLSALLIATCLVTFVRAEGQEPLREMLWVWGNPEMGQPGGHSTASFAQATPMERARILGVPNVIMAGNGLPESDEAAEKHMAAINDAQHIVWEIAPRKEGGQGPFDYTETIARIRRFAARHPKIEGVLLDDMSTIAVKAGLKPEHIRGIRDQLGADNARIRIWGVVYTMNLREPALAAYVRELDVINLWTWHARDLPKLEENVAYCAAQWPDKPIVVGLYLHDYGEGRTVPADLLRQQNETALALARDKRITGVVYLTINNEPDTVLQTAQWIRERTGQTPSERSLRLSGSEAWNFSGEPWTEDAEGVMRPPDKRNLHSRAFYTTEAFGDVSVEFDYNANYRETGTGDAGLILRASDPNHFYYVHFPWGGQQLRAKHFWAGVATIDGDAYQRHVAFEYVPGVPSETDRWYHVRVEAIGPRIRVWVDGRAALDVTDNAYSRGRLGFAGYGWYAFRNVRVAGAASQADEWKPVPLPSHSFTVGLDSQIMPSGCIAPNGDVILAQASKLVRSKDRGRTWGAVEALPASLGDVGDYTSALFRAGDTLRVMVYRPQDAVKKPAPEIAIATSRDNGATWSDPVPSQVAAAWPSIPKSLVPYGPVLITDDGTWLRFLLGGAKEDGAVFTDVRTWGATHAKAYVTRSTDQGAIWSAPIDLDWPTWTGAKRGEFPGSLDLTEPSAVVMGNTVTVLVRPVYSETMWQCWSSDAGLTWDAASRATFPGYAQSIARTQSGAIVCAHRYPQCAVNVSRDGGLNWDAGTVIDYPVWGMGCIVEVEPDVLLCAYMNAERSQPLVAQLVRVKEDRVEPVNR
ncbi:MAG: exo-alpha-sialidase [Candidatus Hydrogenedentes bacterium]|nr:exo-alpha-sialidase [Candidatus Hydrogenedentota bacterium]